MVASVIFLIMLVLQFHADGAADFQLMNLRKSNAMPKFELSGETEERKFMESGTGDRGRWHLKVFHRDAIKGANGFSRHHLFEERILRDVKRVAGLTQQLRHSGSERVRLSYHVTDFGSDVVSGVSEGSGEYFVRIGVGSPARDQYMVIDSGSDMVWVQCQPCSQCYEQADPVFNPAQSATYAGVPCESAICGRFERSSCNGGRCYYAVSYGDGSYTMGTLALETLTFGDTAVRNTAIGCGHKNHGLFIGAAGLLGLGGGPMSFINQLGGLTGGAFGYCLVSRGTASTGSLTFGRSALPAGAVWIPLLRSPRALSFYYVGLVGLGVGGARVPVSEDIFQLTELGEGGVIIDTGTAVTRFPNPAYEALRDAFIASTTSLPRAPRVSIFDTCYDLSGFVSVRVPTISFYFSGGPQLTLPANNFLIPVNEAATYCFAFAPSSSELSIIGNIQQEGIQISFDAANGFVGIGPNNC